MAKSVNTSDGDSKRRKAGRPRTKAPGSIPNSISQIRERLGMSQEDFAEKLKLHPTSVSRIETGASDLSLSRLKQIADVLMVSDPVSLLRPIERLRMVPVVGVVQAGLFVESFVWDEDERYQVAVPDDADLRSIHLEGYELRGPSMNKVYPDRSVVVVAKIIDTGETVTPGKRYVVERRRLDGLSEATVKKFEVDDSGRGWLVPESDQPGYVAIPIDGETDGVEEIRALGRVMWSVRRED